MYEGSTTLYTTYLNIEDSYPTILIECSPCNYINTT